MIVTFSCEAYANTTYFGDVAKQLLTMMGHSGSVPGAILAADVPKALTRLQQALAAQKTAAEAADKSERPSGNDDWKEKPVTLSQRAVPLIELLTAAVNAECNVMWDRG